MELNLTNLQPKWGTMSFINWARAFCFLLIGLDFAFSEYKRGKKSANKVTLIIPECISEQLTMMRLGDTGVWKHYKPILSDLTVTSLICLHQAWNYSKWIFLSAPLPWNNKQCSALCWKDRKKYSSKKTQGNGKEGGKKVKRCEKSQQRWIPGL